MPEAERAVVVEALVEVVAADLAEAAEVRAVVAVTVEASVVSTRDSKM